MGNQPFRDNLGPMPPAPNEPVRPVGTPPPSVVNAARLMYVNAALALVGIIFAFVFRNRLKTAIRNDNPNASNHKIDTMVTAGIVSLVVVGVIFALLWIFLALKVQNGRNWARIVTWIIAGLGVIDLLAGFAQTNTMANRGVGIVAGVIDLAIIVFLCQRPSNDYFAVNRRR